MRPFFLCLALLACSSTVLPSQDDGGGGSTSDDADGVGNNNNQGAGSAGGASPINGGNSAMGGSSSSRPSSMDSMDSMDVEPVGGSSSTGIPLCEPFAGACSQCVANACGEAWCSCLDNQECLALLGCFGDCTTKDCYQGCMSSHPDGAGDAFNVLGCPPCTDECGGATPVDPCTECLYTDCEQELNACVAEPDCLPLWNCLIDCPQGGLSCQSDCYDAYPDGIDTLETMFNCTSSACAGPCQ